MNLQSRNGSKPACSTTECVGHSQVPSRPGRAAVIVGSVLSAVATDAIFAVAEIFAGKKPADGWQEIR